MLEGVLKRIQRNSSSEKFTLLPCARFILPADVSMVGCNTKDLLNLVRGMINGHIAFRRNHRAWQCLFNLSMMVLPSSLYSLMLKVLRGVYRLLLLLIARISFVTFVTLFIAVERCSLCITGKSTNHYV